MQHDFPKMKGSGVKGRSLNLWKFITFWCDRLPKFALTLMLMMMKTVGTAELHCSKNQLKNATAMSDNFVCRTKTFFCRTKTFWKKHRTAYSYLILQGHGWYHSWYSSQNPVWIGPICMVILEKYILCWMNYLIWLKKDYAILSQNWSINVERFSRTVRGKYLHRCSWYDSEI